MSDASTVYEAAARAYAEQIYRGARTIDGQPKAWDLLLENDKRGLIATMRPVVDVVLSFGLLIDFPDQACPGCRLEHPGADCRQPDLFGGEL